MTSVKTRCAQLMEIAKKEKMHESADSILGWSQDALSFGSVLAGGIANRGRPLVGYSKLGAQISQKIAVGAAAAATGVNLVRQELDRTGLVPSESGNLKQQGDILSGRLVGLGSRGLKTAPRSEAQFNKIQLRTTGRLPNPGTPASAGTPRVPSDYENYTTKWQHDMEANNLSRGQAAHQLAIFGSQGMGVNPMVMMGSIASGRSGNVIDDLGLAVASSEVGRKLADPVSDALGLPNIPGISKRLTRKEPYETRRAYDVSTSPTPLDLIAAANARRR